MAPYYPANSDALARADAKVGRCPLCGKQIWLPTGCTLDHNPERP